MTNAESKIPALEELTLEQKVGQLMIWSFSGRELSPSVRHAVTQFQPGALVLFRRNIKSSRQILKLNQDLQNAALRSNKLPLFLMVDQEGGVVTRVRIPTPIPSALALGKTEDSAFIESFARAQADLLRALGFNVNLAPVLDVSDPTKDSFIGSRTFGKEPSRVAELGVAYARGMNAGGVIPTAKHFPGHGGLSGDSHRELPLKTALLEELKLRDFIPFASFAREDYPRFIMMAHIAIPALEDEKTPATYSKALIEGQLRGELNYQGLVITDDLEMHGASIHSSIGERAVRAFLAGNDMIMLTGQPKNQQAAFQALLDAARSGRISSERLDASLTRILHAKSVMSAPPTSYRKVASLIRRLEVLSREVMQKNFKSAFHNTMIRFPALDDAKVVTVFASSPRFHRLFRDAFLGKTRSYSLSPKSLSGALPLLKNAQLGVFYVSGTTTAKFLNQLSPDLRKKLIVINSIQPGIVKNPQDYISVLNMNSSSPESGQWLAESLNTEGLRTPGTTDDETRQPASEN